MTDTPHHDRCDAGLACDAVVAALHVAESNRAAAAEGDDDSRQTMANALAYAAETARRHGYGAGPGGVVISVDDGTGEA